MKKTWIYVLIVVIVVVVVGILISQSEPTVEPVGEEEEVLEEEVVVEQNLMDSPLGTFDANNPQQTELLDEATMPEGVIKFRVSAGKFGPNEFNAVPGRVLSIVLLPSGEPHSLVFDELPNVRIEVGGQESRGISFVAPEEAGDYVFRCDLEGHEGETGVMHVL